VYVARAFAGATKTPARLMAKKLELVGLRAVGRSASGPAGAVNRGRTSEVYMGAAIMPL